MLASMFENVSIIEIIIQAGAVGISVITLYVLYRLLRFGGELAGNHLVHMTEVLTQILFEIHELRNKPAPPGCPIDRAPGRGEEE